MYYWNRQYIWVVISIVRRYVACIFPCISLWTSYPNDLTFLLITVDSWNFYTNVCMSKQKIKKIKKKSKKNLSPGKIKTKFFSFLFSFFVCAFFVFCFFRFFKFFMFSVMDIHIIEMISRFYCYHYSVNVKLRFLFFVNPTICR